MVEQMGEGLPVDRHLEITHVGEIRLSAFTRDMHLLKDDFPLRSLLRTPLCNMALQGAHLRWTILAWLALAQLGEQGRPEASLGRVVTARRPRASPLQRDWVASARCAAVSVG